MKIPFRWRLMQLISAVQLVAAASILVVISNEFFSNLKLGYVSAENWLYYFIAALLLISVISFSILIMYIIQKLFPDHVFPRGMNFYFVVNYILYFINAGAFSVMLFLASGKIIRIRKTAEVLNFTQRRLTTTYIVAAILFILIVSFIYILCYAIKLRRRIRINFYDLQAAEIEMLGNSKTR